MPMDDTDHSMGDPEPPREPRPRPTTRDDVNDRDDTTAERVEEHAAETQLPKSGGAAPDEAPEERRGRTAGEPAPEPPAHAPDDER